MTSYLLLLSSKKIFPANEAYQIFSYFCENFATDEC